MSELLTFIRKHATEALRRNNLDWKIVKISCAGAEILPNEELEYNITFDSGTARRTIPFLLTRYRSAAAYDPILVEDISIALRRLREELKQTEVSGQPHTTSRSNPDSRLSG
ncbi:MAG TPA: hypothetical protein VNQ79_24510 [Blastocatellia bacterium]|nr:hypothetical protein [Blastocatellia bacterium]